MNTAAPGIAKRSSVACPANARAAIPTPLTKIAKTAAKLRREGADSPDTIVGYAVASIMIRHSSGCSSHWAGRHFCTKAYANDDVGRQSLDRASSVHRLFMSLRIGNKR